VRRARKKQKRLSPILDQILNGPPGVSINLSRSSQLIEYEKRIFDCDALNFCFIFKYPNFDIELSKSASVDIFDKGLLSKDRPVETGIYLPSDNLHPENGGFAIYLRQKNAEYLLHRHFGLSRCNNLLGVKDDFEKLAIIDSIPSLDPFLVKTTFESFQIKIDPMCVPLSHSIEQRIKLRISEKVRPIVERAVGVKLNSRGGSEKKFVDAIWDPRLPEAELFIQAFKIDSRQGAVIFSAWKGLSFYEQQFAEYAPHAGRFLNWIKSEASEPYDIRQNKIYKDQQDMYKLVVSRKIINMIKNMRKIFIDFNSAYDAFIKKSDPLPFRSYLLSADKRYWVLGYCCTAIANSINIFERSMSESVNGRVSFDRLNDLLYFVDACVSSCGKPSTTDI